MHFSGLTTISYAVAVSAVAIPDVPIIISPAPFIVGPGPQVTPFTPYPSDSTCSTNSEALKQLTVSNFSYTAVTTFGSPSFQAYGAGVTVFNLTNPAISSYTPQCSNFTAQGPEYFYESQEPHNCTVPENAGSVLWSFDKPTGKLTVNQTWYCTDRNPAQPSTYRASGTAFLAFNCTSTQAVYPSTWQTTQLYSNKSVACTSDAFTVPVTVTGVA